MRLIAFFLVASVAFFVFYTQVVAQVWSWLCALSPLNLRAKARSQSLFVVAPLFITHSLLSLFEFVLKLSGGHGITAVSPVNEVNVFIFI